MREGYLIVNADSTENGKPIVRVFASFDMGWGQRGNGHTYDSLNGYCAIIGLKTGKVLDYCTRNRKCRICDLELLTGVGKPHDCRKNLTGPAKAMEGDGAVQLVTASKILKEHNVQIGVFIGDNDSSSMAAIRSEIDYPIIKQSDMNHTTNNVGSKLYAIQKTSDPNHELTGDVIKHIQRCFTYAVHQNKKHLEKMKAALENVPYHLFDLHKNCGSWCQSKDDKENKTTSIVLKNPSLFDSLINLFDELSGNSDKFISAASSQVNESLNNSMCHKNPKGFLYSTSESTDFRFSATVAEKNLNVSYLQISQDRAGMNHKGILNKHVVKSNKISLNKKIKASTPAFKKNRLELKAKRSQLKNRKANIANGMYSSGMSLLEKNSTYNLAILFFDLETSGLSLKHEILQVCVKFGNQIFKSFITPTQAINCAASKANGLTKVYKKLFQHGVEVVTLPQKQVFIKLLAFLKSIKKKCLLVAHICTFDSSRLILAVKTLNLLEEYEQVIEGFADSLKGAHDASFDVNLLEKLSNKFLNIKDFVETKKSLADVISMLDNSENTQKLLPTYKSMDGIISIAMKKRLCSSGISYEQILSTFKSQGQDETKKLLQGFINGKATIIKSQKILEEILKFLESQ
ncbi:uncharacterized protein LOC131674797 [Phymastichus coffea]|uniref:uncharacterized protein LOC131674797 n=1 Tax=Phymastichus coffea TaxID=108790 RepID=UPI00273AA2D2|nr:uncharacterized protein LOC131674797 [Phymastichus coffea]